MKPAVDAALKRGSTQDPDNCTELTAFRGAALLVRELDQSDSTNL